jgi:integrase
MATINETSVKAHTARLGKAGKLADAFLWDDKLTGFGCKATPAGKRAFFVQYRPRGKGQNIKRVHIGYYGPLTVAQARAKAEKLLGAAKAGGDPREAEKAKRDAALLAKAAAKEKLAKGTLRQCAERFWELNKKSGRYWVHKKARLLGNDMKPLLDKPIGSIKRSDLLDVLDKVKARSENAARLLLVDLRPLFKWALERDLIEANPLTGIAAPKPAEKRERVLEPHEIAAFWQGCEGVSWPFASIYKLLLLTGTRREEVAGMRWSELDLDAGVWTLPGTRTKNKRDHRLPLAPAAVALLDRAGIAAIKQGYGYADGDLVFSTTGITAPSGWSKAKAALDKAMQELLGPKFRPWRVHDLRRTAATGMEDLGIPTHIVETALNHVSGAKAGIVGVYQRAAHREAVKRAFLAWERRLLELTGGDSAPVSNNVVQLRAAN